jgi:hypothetical protein
MAISDDGSPLNTVELKSIVEKAEEVEQASSKVATSAAEIDSHDERVLRNLETTGEEIGFTWRSIMAVVVSLLLSSFDVGGCLQPYSPWRCATMPIYSRCLSHPQC